MSERLVDLRLLGGRPALDFVNTVDPRHSADRIDFLADYADLLVWLPRSWPEGEGLIEPLRTEFLHRPAAAADVLAEAVGFREHLYDLLRPDSGGTARRAEALASLERMVLAAVGARRLRSKDGGVGGVREAGGAAWRWEVGDDLRLPLYVVALDAEAILTTASWHRVKECPGPDGCGWLFEDVSKNGSRRWCSMEVCGNRSKVRRHRAQ